MLLEERVVSSDAMQDQVERILRSDEFRSSEVLRRLLLYLAEKAASGEADQLKEYIVAIEGLGKPSSYDPQHNSGVRIQVGRLRQKLAEYYRGEGKADPLVIELPKGRFRLVCEPRQGTSAIEEPMEPQGLIAAPEIQEIALDAAQAKRPNLGTLLVGVALGMALLTAGYLLLRPMMARSKERGFDAAAGWSPALETLWQPFLTSNRPLIISIEDPLFVELHSNPGVYFRDRSLNEWKDVKDSRAVQGISKAMKSEDIQPSRYYTAYGEVEASYLLGKLLGPHVATSSLLKASQLTWQQLADNNVVFVGVENLFFEQTQGMPVQAQLVPVLEGVRNPHPRPGEPELFADQYVTAPREQGVVYAMVTHLPGPLGNNEVESFTSNRSAGYVGAVQWFSNPKFARLVVDKLTVGNGGTMPRYYQVLLKVSFKDDVPIETTYVLSRELH